MKIEAAKATAKWWREKITNCNHDNGDNSFSSVMAGRMADLLALENKPTEEQLNKFEEALVDLISKDNITVVSLMCDYNPCGILYEAATIARIDSSVFPWKVNTVTTDEVLSVSDGYAKPWVNIEIK